MYNFLSTNRSELSKVCLHSELARSRLIREKEGIKANSPVQVYSRRRHAHGCIALAPPRHPCDGRRAVLQKMKKSRLESHARRPRVVLIELSLAFSTRFVGRHQIALKPLVSGPVKAGTSHLLKSKGTEAREVTLAHDDETRGDPRAPTKPTTTYTLCAGRRQTRLWAPEGRLSRRISGRPRRA